MSASSTLSCSVSMALSRNTAALAISSFVAIILASHLSVSFGDTSTFTDKTASIKPLPYPANGVVFGTPPEDDGDLVFVVPEEQLGPPIIAEYEVSGGFVRFVNENNSVSTIVKGDRSTFDLIAKARTIGELFELVAPTRTSMPKEIAAARDEPFDGFVISNGSANGKTLESELEHGDDDWAEGCSGDSINLWEDNFNNWHGFFFGDDSFSTTDYWDFGTGSINPVYGFFGLLDEIWAGVCEVSGGVTDVRMQHRTFDFCDSQGCGNWEWIQGTEAVIGDGERYLYHNHSIYSALRRIKISSIGQANYSGWKYFISGAGTDTFEPDEQVTSP